MDTIATDFLPDYGLKLYPRTIDSFVRSIACYDSSVTVPSVEQAAIAAGQLEYFSEIGNCVLFANSTTVNPDNEKAACEIVSFLEFKSAT